MEQNLTVNAKTGIIHPETRIATVSLTVANLENQLDFYRHVLGFQLHWQKGDQAGLGTDTQELLHLVERPDARRYNRVTGLYHFAMLFPQSAGTGTHSGTAVHIGGSQLPHRSPSDQDYLSQ